MKQSHSSLSPNWSLVLGPEVWRDHPPSSSGDLGKGNHVNGRKLPGRRRGQRLSVLSLSVLTKQAIFLTFHFFLMQDGNRPSRSYARNTIQTIDLTPESGQHCGLWENAAIEGKHMNVGCSAPRPPCFQVTCLALVTKFCSANASTLQVLC